MKLHSQHMQCWYGTVHPHLKAVEWQIHDKGSLVCMCTWVLCLSNCMRSRTALVEYASSLPLNAVEWQIHDKGSLVCMCPWVLCLSNCMGSRMHCFRCKFTSLKCGGMADSRQWVQCSFGSLRPGGWLLHEHVERLCTS